MGDTRGSVDTLLPIRCSSSSSSNHRWFQNYVNQNLLWLPSGDFSCFVISSTFLSWHSAAKKELSERCWLWRDRNKLYMYNVAKMRACLQWLHFRDPWVPSAWGTLLSRADTDPTPRRAHILENRPAEFLVGSLDEQFCGDAPLLLVFHHPQVLCSLIGYFNALAHVLGTSPCKLTSVPEFLLPRKALYLTAPSWRIFLPF